METIARPYARAVFSVAQEQRDFNYWLELLDAISQLLQVKDFANAMKDPTQVADDKLKILNKLLAVMQIILSKEASNLLLLLINKRRVDMIPAISDLFVSMWQATGDQLEVNVTTAFELSNEEKQSLADKLSKLTGKQSQIKEKVDESLIGGLIIEWDGKTLDGSIRGKLEKLSTSL